MSKYYCPSWELTKEASMRVISRLGLSVMKGKYDPEARYFIPNQHNPVHFDHGENGKRIYGSLEFLIPVSPEISGVFFHTEAIKGKVVRPKGFHKNIFLEILAKSCGNSSYDGYFYILECSGFYKIGIAQDYKSRKRTYVTENPHPIREIFADKIPCADRVEAYLKKAFRHKNHRGEWFNFSKRDLLYIDYALTNIRRYETEII